MSNIKIHKRKCAVCQPKLEGLIDMVKRKITREMEHFPSSNPCSLRHNPLECLPSKKSENQRRKFW